MSPCETLSEQREGTDLPQATGASDGRGVWCWGTAVVQGQVLEPEVAFVWGTCVCRVVKFLSLSAR